MPDPGQRAGAHHARLILLLFAASFLAASVLPAGAREPNPIRGGLLYDDYSTVKDLPEPTGNHPLYPAGRGQAGSDTFRCQECHGWDYKGAAGAYGQGPHFTGIRGVFGSTKTAAEMFSLIKQAPSVTPGGHGYGALGLNTNDVNDLVAFLKSLLIDTDVYIDAANRFRGDAAQGQVGYSSQCARCHGDDGTALNFNTDEEPEFLGTIAENDPWALLHKIRVGQPGEGPDMPSWLALGGNDRGAADIGRYIQDADFPTGTEPEPCQPGACDDDGNPCTANACDPIAGCQSVVVEDGTSCADGNLCNGIETCQSGVCTSAAPRDCNDQNECTTDACVAETGCEHANLSDGTGCPDATICNGAETCQAGVCSSGPPLDCNDGDDCRTDTCNAITGCINTPIPGCLLCADDLDCNDRNLCTADTCDAGACRNTPVTDGAACSDINLCNGRETCQGGVCAGTATVSCDDQNPCTLDVCDRVAGCQHSTVPSGASCADTDRCNGNETCQAGTCTGGTALGCDDRNPCTADVCDPAGGCQHPPADGAPCSDGDTCHGAGTCQAGACAATSALDCNDGDECTVDGCNPASGCTHTQVTGAAGVLCELEQGLGATPCPNQPLLRGLSRSIERGKALIRQAMQAESAAGGRKSLLKAGQELRKARRRLARIARAGKLGAPCADALKGVLDEAREEIAGTLTPRPRERPHAGGR